MVKVKVSMSDIPNFSLLAPSIWEYSPPFCHLSVDFPRKDVEVPSLILLCSWTGAQNRYIAKYTAEYHSFFPSTRMMVITTSAKDLCFRNSSQKQERLIPAVERIISYKHLNDDGMKGGILLHVFSEGGSHKACELAEAYHKLTATRLPVSALCFDSTPGRPRYFRLCNALSKSLPPVPVLRHTGLFFGSAVIGAIWMTYRLVKGWENNVILRTRRRINDPVHFNLSAPRCYLYSKDDELIAWQDIYEHVEESIYKGISAQEVLFEGSGHVEHAKMEPRRYWDAVMATWRSASCGSGSGKEIPRLEIRVEEVDLTITLREEASVNQRWSNADSERTLFAESRYSGYSLVD